MSLQVLHLNLLQDSERLSSSPIRLKVMLPFVCGGALAAMLGWWGFLFLQQGLVDSELATLRRQVSSHAKDHAEVRGLKDALLRKEAELGQLKGYQRGRLTWGETLAAVASSLPEGIQLTSVEIPEPPPQNLNPPPGVKLPPLLGPTNTEENVVFRLAGRTDREQNLLRFLETVKASAAFTNNLLVVAGGARPSPRMRQFGQDATADSDGSRAIVFDIEYRTRGRDFAP